MVRRARLGAIDHSTPARRIFEGIAAFVNHCIDEGKTVYSYRLRLFSWRPDSADRYVRLRSTR